MGHRKQYLGFLAIVGLLAAGTPLHAAPILWTLSGVTFVDGATASGSFMFDASSDTYSDWNIIVTPGLFSAYDYLPGVDGGFAAAPTGQVDFVAFPPATPGRYLRLAVSTPLSDAGGTDFLLTDGTGYECDNCNDKRFITGGEVTTLPEPGTWSLVGGALIAGALLQRKRKVRFPVAKTDF